MRKEIIIKDLSNYLKYNHIGLCLFTSENFFEDSELSLALKFLLNWKNNLTTNFNKKFDQSLFLSNLYDRNFPVIFNKKRITQASAVDDYLNNYAQLISGLCIKHNAEQIEFNNPQILVIVDQDIEDNKINKDFLKNIKTFKYSLDEQKFSSQSYLTYDLFEIPR